MDTNAKLLTIGQFAALHGINKKHSCGMTKSDYSNPLSSTLKMAIATTIIIKARCSKPF